MGISYDVSRIEELVNHHYCIYFLPVYFMSIVRLQVCT